MANNLKELFDYEFQLLDSRPFISDDELDDPHKVRSISSFDMVSDDKSLFIKFKNRDGDESEVLEINPIAARALAMNIMNSLNDSGLAKDVIIPDEELDKEKTSH